MSDALSPAPDDPILLVHAYLDGELDPAAALAIERRMAADPALAAERERIAVLRRLIQERLPRDAVPPGLRARIETAIGLRPVRPRPTWTALAASIALTAMIASGSTWLLRGGDHADSPAGAVLAAHVRALIAPQPADVMSSEQHTVKPWFNGRIPEAPRVIDLSSAGFPLVGGRIDVVGQRPVPTLVYRRRQHLISLTALIATSDASVAPTPSSINGYNLIAWTDNGVLYWAVSDVGAPDLLEFRTLFRAAP
jgi:anti-sigma factor RsiW